MNNRISFFIDSMSKLPVESVLVTDTSDIFYLTGINLEGFILLLTKDGAFVFSPLLLADQIKSLTDDMTIIKGDKIFNLLFDFCKKNKIKEIGIDASKINYSLGVRLKEHLKVKDIASFNMLTRQIKDEIEISNIKHSCKIASSAVNYIENWIKPGVTEKQVEFKIEEYFAKNMVRPAFTTIVASGSNSANPHHISSNKKIQKNDVVLIDLGCIYNGYCSDLTRTFFLGKIDNLQKKIYTLVDKARIEAINKIRSGKKTADIDKTARDIISKAGYGKRFIHSTGHGIGIQIHEAPRLSKNDKTILKAGMTVTIEPGIYFENNFGIRIEDSILITEKGCEVLTR